MSCADLKWNSHLYFQCEEEAEKKQADNQSKVQEAMQEVGYEPDLERQDTDEPDIGLMEELEEDDDMTDEQRVSVLLSCLKYVQRVT